MPRRAHSALSTGLFDPSPGLDAARLVAWEAPRSLSAERLSQTGAAAARDARALRLEDARRAVGDERPFRWREPTDLDDACPFQTSETTRAKVERRFQEEETPEVPAERLVRRQTPTDAESACLSHEETQGHVLLARRHHLGTFHRVADGNVVSRDGVAFVTRGDVILAVYHLAARLDRTRWLFDEADRFLAARPNGAMAFLVILQTADPPDAATRKENADRLRRCGRSLRRMVSACIGDAFRVSVARAIMRGLSIVQGFARPTFVTDTVEDGLARLLEGATSETPSREALLRDLSAACRALRVAPADWPIPPSPDMAAPPPR